MTDDELDQLSAKKDRLIDWLFPTDGGREYDEIDGVGIGTSGDKKPCFIVNLERDPEWKLPFDNYYGTPVVWKVKGKVFAP
jgi:hypothetical protein